MNTTIHNPEALPDNRRPTTWVDLILYFLFGFGFFIAGSTALSQVSEIGTTFDTAARFLLNFASFAGAFLIVGILRRRVTWQSVGLRWQDLRWYYVPIAALLAIGLMPSRALIGLGIQYLLEGNLESLQFRSDVIAGAGFSWPAFFLSLIGIGILAPIAEEFFFRGLVHTWLQPRLSFWLRILISSAIFGLGHIDSIGVVISSFIMGIVIALAFELSRSLWLPILIHVTTNSVAIILVYVTLALAPASF